MNTARLVKLIVGAGVSHVALQTLPSSDVIGIASKLENIGVVGFLALAVIFLWRTLQDERKAKDATIQLVVKALTLDSETNRELRATIQESINAKNALAKAIEELRYSLGQLPCILDDAPETTHKRH